MPQLFPIIQAYIEDQGWKIASQDESRFVMLFGDAGNDEKNCLLVIHGREQQQDILVRSLHPSPAPEHARSKICEFMARANFGMNLGSFKIDESDGEMYYECSADVEHCNAEDVTMLVDTMVRCVRQIWDRYQAGVITLCKVSDVSAETAVRIIEG
eukprot:TRINITY_DN1639_c0_g1_i1.p1 TRINITY_DN1639_c0_g1~~TRINITY_DN1639_c0_g1_i1.p1  ORF type:complete len:175 (-),score=38.34 TRINITY_DN1639_c0_g1_i1:37-504(-)